MKASIIYLLSKKLRMSAFVFVSCVLCTGLQAQSAMRETGFGKYDYSSGSWYNVDSLKQTWLGNFGGDEDHYNGNEWKLTYREAINSNHSSINYASRYFNTYNTDNQLITSILMEWDGSIFQNSTRSNNTFDGQGRKIQILQENWTAGAWAQYELYLDSFDNSGRVIREQIMLWNAGTSTWDHLQITVTEYNAAGKATLYQTTLWNGTAWINQDKVEKAYDLDNYILTQTTYTGSGSNWNNSVRWSYQYDLNHNMTIYSYFTWNAVPSAWKNFRRDLYNYDGNNLKTDWTEQTWSTAWDNAFKYTFTYNAANLVETSTRQNWSGTWDNYRKYIDQYNANGFLTEDKSQNWDAGAWVDATKTTHIRNGLDQKTLSRDETYTSGAWTILNEKYYYYEAYTPVSGLEEINNGKGLKGYPNPFTQNCLVEFESEAPGQNQIQVFDLSGRVIKEANAWFPAGTNQWFFDGKNNTGNEIPAGMYIVKIEAGGKTAVQKISKL